MIGLKVKKKRFTLLYLEENEFYVQDLSGSCTVYNFSTETMRTEKGKIHICSKSIIFEPTDYEVPIYKFLFRYMKSPPRKYADIINQKYSNSSLQKLFDGKTGEDQIIIHMKRIVEISTNGPPSPYMIQDGLDLQLAIIPAFENLDKTMTKLQKLYEMVHDLRDSAELEHEITNLIFEDRKKKFDISHLESINERPIIKNQIIARRILPLISIHGILYITNANIYFQSIHSVGSKPVKRIEIPSIDTIFKRRYELRHIGLELFTTTKSYLFAFDNTDERDEVYNALLKKVRPDCISETSLERITQQWEREEISNFEYLKYLNEAADRTFSDLTQYPVYPWVIKEYESETLDLNDPSVYRDLSKPIGALNPKRLAEFKMRYNDMQAPKYLYGTHYSAPGYVIGYLFRKNPEYMLKLQSGRFDKPDRLFTSIRKDWGNVINNHAIVKELIPEFYGEDPSFLVNAQKLDLGIRQNGKRVNDVNVPKWAKDADEFLKMNREALESKYVSENLHHWIDLIFGYKQRGPQAIDADNVFHYMTYEGLVDLEKIIDPNERNALKIQINEFGQTPKQLFKIPHPHRYAWKEMHLIHKSISTSYEEHKYFDDKEEGEDARETALTDSPASVAMFSPIKGNSVVDDDGKKVADKPAVGAADSIWSATGLEKLKVSKVLKIHKSEISSIELMTSDKVLTTGGDGFIKIFDILQQTITKSFKVCDLNIPTATCLKENEIYALGGWDNNLYVFNLNYGNKVFNSYAHGDAVSAVEYVPSKSIILTSSWDCTIKSWKVRNNNIEKSGDEVIVEGTTQITSLAVSKSGHLIAYGDVEGNLTVRDLRSDEEMFTTAVAAQKMIAIKFSANNNEVIAVTEAAVALYDQTGNEIMNLPADPHCGSITGIDYTANSLVTVTDKGHCSVYSLLQSKKMGSFLEEYESADESAHSPESELVCCKVSQDGRFAAFGSKCGSLTFANYEDAQ